MKFSCFFFAAALCCFHMAVIAQNAVPAGFKKAMVTFSNGISMPGFGKDNIKKNSTVVFMDSTGNKKQYDGNAIKSITIDTVDFICIKGDFFRVISAGKIDFLQKAGNAAGNPVYNGSEAVFVNGTEGKTGDYFVYSNNKLQLLSKRNIDAFINTGLAGCAEAIQKAKSGNGDIATIAVAIILFNNYAAK